MRKIDGLIIGCGDIGGRLARRLLDQGQSVLGLVRTPASVSRLEALGVPARILDLDHPLSETPLFEASTVFYLAPPPNTGLEDSRIPRVLGLLKTPPERWVYVSTSGVYGDCQGAWVTEERKVAPATDRARRRYHAECQLNDYAKRRNVSLTILRVPGIYGPDRLPYERLQRQLPVVVPEEAPYSNRIHADDLARACLFVADRHLSGGLYNISDGHPTTMTDYFFQVADHLGLPRPPCLPLAEALQVLGPSMASFLKESRRLDSRRLSEGLGFQCQYPTLAEGLSGIAPS